MAIFVTLSSNSIAIDSDGGLWFGTNGGVSRYDGENLTRYTESDGLADNDVRAIAIDNDGVNSHSPFGTLNQINLGLFPPSLFFEGGKRVSYFYSTENIMRPILSAA